MTPTSRPTTLPPRRDWLLFCSLTALLLFVGWSAFAWVAQTQQNPELEKALLAVQSGKEDQAAVLFNQAMRGKTGEAALHLLFLGACQQNRRWRLLTSHGKRAIVLCEHASATDRAKIYSFYAFGLSETRPPRWKEEAVKAAKQAYDLDSGNPEMQNQYGYMLADLGPEISLDTAQTLLERARQQLRGEARTPEQAMLQLITEDSYAWLLCRRGQYGESIASLTHLLSTIPADAKAPDLSAALYYHLGMAYLKAERLDEARTALKTALDYRPDYVDARHALNSPPLTGTTALPSGIPSLFPPNTIFIVPPFVSPQSGEKDCEQ